MSLTSLVRVALRLAMASAVLTAVLIAALFAASPTARNWYDEKVYCQMTTVPCERSQRSQ